VNVLLSVITLGVYSPWATVRTRRYFHGNTVLAGAHFDYHANARSILIARVILVLFIIGGSFIAGNDALRAGLHSSLIFILLPWALARGFAFNARNTSYRGVRFDFIRRERRLYFIFAPAIVFVVAFNALVAALTLSPDGEALNLWVTLSALAAFVVWFVASPFVARAYHKYKAEHHRIGGLAFDFRPPRLGAYMATLWLLPLCVAALFAGLGWVFLSVEWLQTVFGEDDALAVYLGLQALMLIAAYLLLTSLLFKFYWRGVCSRRARVICSISAWRFAFAIRFVNLVAALLTLGLAIPWARIRRAKYLAANLALQVESPALDALVTSSAQAGSAFGAEFAASEGFEFDVGLV